MGSSGKANSDNPFATIDEALEWLRQGEFIIVIDDEDRENEGDLIIASEFATPDSINFMAKYGRGLICVPMTGERLDDLGLNPMVSELESTALLETPYTVSVDARDGVTTGISAYDRARTIEVLIDEDTRPSDLAKPGHIFPLRAKKGGVLTRAGHTEATVDLMKLAGLYPAGVLCEIMSDDGTMARLDELVEMSEKHGLQIVTIKDLIEYRYKRDNLVERRIETHLPTCFGDFELIVYGTTVEDDLHLALVRGDVEGEENVLVRVHSQCLTGDVFGSRRCDCGDQLHYALQLIDEEGEGVLLYMRQEGRGIGLMEKLRSYVLQDEGVDTVDANILLGHPPDTRHYGHGAQILADLGLSTIRLITNNPAKRVGLESYGLKVVERIPIICSNEDNIDYLKTKRERMGHLLPDMKDDKGEK